MILSNCISAQTSASDASTSYIDETTDDSFSDLVRSGDEDAFREFIRRNWSRVYGITFSLSRDRTDAEELTQDTFIRVKRGLETFRGDSSLETWMHRIAVNLSRNRYWYWQRRRKHDMASLNINSKDATMASLPDLIGDQSADPAQAQIVSEFEGLVAKCMSELEPSQRDILTLLTSRNQNYGQIAKRLRINIGTVKSRIARARSSLRAQLRLCCPSFAPGESMSHWLHPQRLSSGLLSRA